MTMSRLQRTRLGGLIPALFVASALVLMNLMPVTEVGRSYETEYFGWPGAFYSETKSRQNEGAVFSDGGSLTHPRTAPIWTTDPHFYPNGLLVNILLGTLFVLVIWLVFTAAIWKVDGPI
jgi:hypothetical protein